jgi:hypothetical protein
VRALAYGVPTSPLVTCAQLLFTPEQLSQYSAATSKRPMLAIMGEVYDVSKAPQYYGAHPWSHQGLSVPKPAFRTVPV